MPPLLSYRFWLESILGSLTGLAAIVTLLWPGWIEAIFGTDPDGGSGSAERLIVVISLSLTAALVFGARLEWRRAKLADR